MIRAETVKEFQDAIQAEFGFVLNETDATNVLHKWVAYFDLLARIDSRTEVQTSQSISMHFEDDSGL